MFVIVEYLRQRGEGIELETKQRKLGRITEKGGGGE